MKKFVAPALGLALLAGLLAGCGKGNPSQPQNVVAPTAADVAQVNDAVAASPGLVDENVYEDNSPTALDTGGGFAAIRPMFWWRTIRSVTRTFDTQFMNPDSLGRPTLAVVSVHRRLQGSFNILVGDSASSPDSILRKPLDDRWERRLLLKRVRVIDSTGTSRWRIVGTSGVEVTSVNAHVAIQSLRVQAGPLDTTITDPLQLHRLRRVLLVPAGTEITVTVTTGSASDLVLLYRWDHRFRFHNNGDGTFTFHWTTSDEPGLRHFGVNALSHGTLFDDAAPYDSQAWIIPFVVHPEIADLDR
jgi:hypothetical protein